MTEYAPPLADLEFVLAHVTDLDAVAKLNGFQHADRETVAGVLAEAGRFFAEVIAPTNRHGDLEGSRLVDGSVRTPSGFREVYRTYLDAGWAGVHLPEAWGGGGMPLLVGMAVHEMFKSSNLALSLCTMLTQASIDALMEHGSPEQQATYLEKLVTGEWSGTMCLTEPHAGSDVGALTSRAEPQADGSYRISGQKIFITWGDQDLTENVIHLVLARTPGSAPGTKGISLFLVPKYLPDAAGLPGERNAYEIVSLEHKLGIHASPTCVVEFTGATGYLVGEEQQGMRYMFTMMNTARIEVGAEGLAVGERAYQQASSYSRERTQGRAVGAEPGESSPIIDHPDVRRMLLSMRSQLEAMRALLYTTVYSVDHHRHAVEESVRAFHGDRVALLTPIVKAWLTDRGVEIASTALQVHGGMGYVEETGAAQFYRDSRISPIYEGTNGIQAIDLVLRKIPLSGGEAVAALLDEMEATAGELGDKDNDLGTRLTGAVATGREVTAWLSDRLEAGGYQDALAAATPYLDLMGTLAGGWLMGRSWLAATRQLELEEGDRRFLEQKLTTCRFYLTQLLPKVEGLAPQVMAGADILYATDL
ncbi:MAG TPA: acyl-CoA dehydrogenase [Acidimicrobiia bacterium]|nr:acyl-CoA dehydrogenase [Acidimicrobiia bacterium]